MFTNKCTSQIRLLFFLLSGILFAQNKTFDFGLLGNVESMQSITKSYQNPNSTEVSGFLDSEMYDSIFMKFDRRRNVVLRENFLDYRGKLGLFNRTTLQLNSNRMIEKLETTLIQNGEEPRKISQRKIYYYFGTELIRMDEFNSGRTSDQFWVNNSIYSDKKLAQKVIWMEDEIFSRVEYSYDLRQRLQTEKSFSNNGKLGKRMDFEYDTSGNLIKKIIQVGNEKTIEAFVFDDDRKTSFQLLDKLGKILHQENYNESGWIKSLQKLNHRTQQIDLYEFDYRTDEMNNWTSCTIRKNQIPEFSIERKIKYYKQ